MDHDLEVFPDPAGVAARAAGYVAGLARAAVAAGSRFSFAISGGQTPWAMFRALAAEEDMPWTSAELFGVDERVAPAGDPDRNLPYQRHRRMVLADAQAAERVRGAAPVHRNGGQG